MAFPFHILPDASRCFQMLPDASSSNWKHLGASLSVPVPAMAHWNKTAVIVVIGMVQCGSIIQIDLMELSES